MRLLIVGAGGVGSALADIALRRPFIEHVTLGDVNKERASRAAAKHGERATALALDASDQAAIVAAVGATRAEAVINACDPRFNPPIFAAARQAGVTYLDMAMTLSHPHPERPYELPGVKLGDAQFAAHEDWAAAGLLALVGIGVESGLSDVFARYAQDHLFSDIDQTGVRDGANLTVEGYDFAPTFSIWTTIEECLNPPVIWEEGRGWYTTAPFSEPEVFDFPQDIGPVECVNVEHEEVLLIPRWVRSRRVTFKYGLGNEFIETLKTLRKLGLHRTDPVRVRGVEVSPRDVVAACLPDPATLGERMHGKTCAGTWVTGTATDGRPREVYLYHVADNQWCMREWGHQCVVWQTAINPMIALELVHSGAWRGVGVRGPEAFPAAPFVNLLLEYGGVAGLRHRSGPHEPWQEGTLEQHEQSADA